MILHDAVKALKNKVFP